MKIIGGMGEFQDELKTETSTLLIVQKILGGVGKKTSYIVLCGCEREIFSSVKDI